MNASTALTDTSNQGDGLNRPNTPAISELPSSSANSQPTCLISLQCESKTEAGRRRSIRGGKGAAFSAEPAAVRPQPGQNCAPGLRGFPQPAQHGAAAASPSRIGNAERQRRLDSPNQQCDDYDLENGPLSDGSRIHDRAGYDENTVRRCGYDQRRKRRLLRP